MSAQTMMQLSTGKLVDVAMLKAEDVDVTAASWSLAQLPRFAGHLRRTFSVGQHSLAVLQVAVELMGDTYQEMQFTPRQQALVQLRALTHDMHESLTGDIPSPVKALIDSDRLRAMHFAYDVLLMELLDVDYACGDVVIEHTLARADAISMILEDTFFGHGARFIAGHSELDAARAHAERHASNVLYNDLANMAVPQVAARVEFTTWKLAKGVPQ